MQRKIMAYEVQMLDPFVNDGEDDAPETEEVETTDDEISDDTEDDGLSDADL
jgi:hypothetical protein